LASNRYLDGWVSYRTKRIVFYWIITVIALGLPWITISDAHFFLLNFDDKKLHLFFNIFDMQELYLMPFLLIILFIGIFFMTVLGGRVFCGWACPQTIFRVVYRDFIETTLLGMRKSIKNKQKNPDLSKDGNGFKKLIAILIWVVLAFVAAADFTWYFLPPETFFEYVLNPMEHTVLLGFLIAIASFLIYDVIWLKEDFCVYICPYSRVQSVLYDDDTIMAIYDTQRGGEIFDEHKEKIANKRKDLPENAECTTCESCVTVCPTHIDIRKGLQLECINCLECVDACTVVMGKLEKPTLVEWSSVRETVKKEGKTQYFRNKVIAYIVALVAVAGILVVMSGEKENMLLNINKETRLYSIEDQDDSSNKKRVKNDYTFLFQNTDTKDHEYYFSVEHLDINIKKPSKSFKLRAGQKAKKIVVLYTDEVLATNDQKDVTIPIKIKAYATDDPNIQVMRDSVFVYPRIDILNKKY
jgi:cytochrome c oxidase accessory protein FixG